MASSQSQSNEILNPETAEKHSHTSDYLEEQFGIPRHCIFEKTNRVAGRLFLLDQNHRSIMKGLKGRYGARQAAILKKIKEQ